MWNIKKTKLNKNLYKTMSYFLAFSGLENSLLATESLSLMTTIEKNMATANSTQDCVSIVNDAKETRYSRHNHISKYL